MTRRRTIRKVALLVLIAALAPEAAHARGGIKVLGAIPDAFWGTWAPGAEACKAGSTEAIVLSAKAYAGPLGKCDVASVSESPSPKGATYSARLQCGDPGQAQKRTANLIIRPGDADQISLGPAFKALRVHQRCS
jgi:hypothetical protein